MMSLRWMAYSVALSAAAALFVFGDKTPVAMVGAEVVGVAARTANSNRAEAPAWDAPATAAVPAPAAAWAPLRPRDSLWRSPQSRAPIRDLFAVHSWAPPPVPAPLATPLPPQAPPVPFTYIGKRSDGQQWDVFLARGDFTFIVREGTIIENTYRIDKIKPPTLTMTYLPMSHSQPLPIGGAD